jgi:formylglycine-generating enzyme required for sulfatase activity
MLFAQESVELQVPEGFVLVKAGSFRMGSESTPEADAAEYGGKADQYVNEKPAHWVTISRSFYMSQFEVTQKQWEDVMGTNPFYPKGENLPVWNLSWYNAVQYCNRLSQKEGLVPCYTIDKELKDANNIAKTDSYKWTITCDFLANGYRLPTEAEWEFAAKGGEMGQSFAFSGSNSVEEVGWYSDNSGNKIQPVGQLKPNELGLYDMSGNVMEWCWDWFGDYTKSSRTDPTGPSSGTARIRRGGRFNFVVRSLRSTARDYSTPSAPDSLMEWLHGTAGLRPARTAE